jgi:uncharacterized membrane protein YdjX (TVP38/TMEM64 family)
VFVGLYVVAVLALVPAAALTALGGALFGVAIGFLVAFAGAVLGSYLAFLLGRHTLRRLIAQRLERMPRLAAVERAVSARGRRIVFLLRLSPIVPFNLLNYALGLTTISSGDYLIASTGMIPATLAYAYAGDVASIALSQTADVSRQASYLPMLAAGLAATVVAAVIVARAARRALRDV